MKQEHETMGKKINIEKFCLKKLRNSNVFALENSTSYPHQKKVVSNLSLRLLTLCYIHHGRKLRQMWLACSLMVGRSSGTQPTRIQILVLALFSGFIPGFSGVMRLVVSDVPVDDETPVVTSRISKFVGAQSFGDARGWFVYHKGMICVWRLMVSDVPVDDEAPVLTSRISKYVGSQYFGGARVWFVYHKGMICVCVFIGWVCVLWAFALYCVNKKKKNERNGMWGVRITGSGGSRPI
jgi:hypothetical protein